MAAAGQEWVKGVKVSHGRSRGAHRSTLTQRYVDGRTHCHLDNIRDYEQIHNLPRSWWYWFEFSALYYYLFQWMIIDWIPELEVQMVPQRRALAVQLKMKMVKPMQQSTLLLQLASFLGLIPQELQGVLWRLSVLVGLHC